MDLRVRSSRGITSVPNPVYVKNISCTDSTEWYLTGYVPEARMEGQDLTMYDYPITRFHARSKAGEVFFNPMSRDRLVVTSQSSDWHRKNQSRSCIEVGNERYGEQNVPGGIPMKCIPITPLEGRPVEFQAITQSDIDRVATLVSTEVLSKRGRSDSDLWESLAEYKQVLDLLGNPLTKLQGLSKRLLKSVEHGTTGRNLVKEVSAGHLLYRYGITPLMKDVENIVKSLSKVTGKQRKTSRAGERLYATSHHTGVIVPYGVLESSWSCETIDSMNIRGMSLDEVDLSFIGNLGFSLKSFLTLPYELTGYSFVADWFANMGDVIGAHAPSLGYNQLGSALTINRVTTQSYSFDCAELPGYTLIGPCRGTVGVSRETKTRGKLYAPGLRLRSDFGFSGFTRTADAFALLASRFTKINTLVGPQPNLSAFRQKKAYSLWLKQPGVN
jgi:hypothetical protein